MKVCIVAAGLTAARWRLQPWRYLIETARGLGQSGHLVTILSTSEDGGPVEESLAGVNIHRLPDVRPVWWQANPALANAIRRLEPELLIWHLGLTSFFHFDIAGRFSAPSIGVFTSPVYDLRELLRPGLPSLVAEKELSIAHFVGRLVPGIAIRRSAQSGLRRLVTLSETARQRLIGRGAPANHVACIPPGLEAEWQESFPADQLPAARQQLGFAPDDVVVAYAGAPMRLRGIDALVRAVARARENAPRLKLLILSRRHNEEMAAAELRVRNLIAQQGLLQVATVVSGFLDRSSVKCYLAASDIVALPFELVPSDMPLSVLEALALGKPVVTTTAACLPEMVPADCGVCVPPADVAALANALVSLATNRERREQMAAWARAFGAQWPSWEQVGSRWAYLLQQL
ncbi:MAG: glycosyltransferase family 4 protein [Chloroflexi bacterium]|nr:glycosyltransferase family 4 protein [Chloroflexota bacterium]